VWGKSKKKVWKKKTAAKGSLKKGGRSHGQGGFCFPRRGDSRGIREKTIPLDEAKLGEVGQKDPYEDDSDEMGGKNL